MKRIVIIGSSSSGKTTLGKKLANILNIKHQELDYFYWLPNWQESDREDFRQKVDPFIKEEQWIVDGNYSSARDLIWGRATHVIWLDYSLPLILKQFFIRSIKRSLSKEVLWHGNTETFWGSVIASDSLLLWILKTYKRNKKVFSKLIQSDQFSHIQFHQFKNPDETQKFLDSLQN